MGGQKKDSLTQGKLSSAGVMTIETVTPLTEASLCVNTRRVHKVRLNWTCFTKPSLFI